MIIQGLTLPALPSIRALLIVTALVGLVSTCYAEDVQELSLSGEQLKQYRNSYKMPEVLRLRKFLNTYADSREKIDPNEEKAAESLDSKNIDKKIIRGKFIVYWVEGFLGGGKEITIVSQEHPEIILSFWIYKVTDKIYQVRDLVDRPDDRDLKSFKKRYFKYLNDKDLAM